MKLFLLLALVIVSIGTTYAMEPPPIAREIYKLGEGRCKAQVLILNNIEERAHTLGLHTPEDFKAGMISSGAVPEGREMSLVMKYVTLYYNSAQRPWVSHEEPDRTPLSVLKQLSYMACHSKLIGSMNEQMKAYVSDPTYVFKNPPDMDAWMEGSEDLTIKTR